MKQPDEFKIPPAPWQEVEKAIESLATQVAAKLAGQGGVGEVGHAVPANVVKGMAHIATNVWRAKKNMIDGASGEVRDDMKRVYPHIEKALESLREMGLKVEDHTGVPFDYGLPLKVIDTKPTQGITRESICETIKPTLFWQEQRIQMGEVVIATPASTDTKI